jgi:hypothetical protein
MALLVLLFSMKPHSLYNISHLIWLFMCLDNLCVSCDYNQLLCVSCDYNQLLCVSWVSTCWRNRPSCLWPVQNLCDPPLFCPHLDGYVKQSLHSSMFCDRCVWLSSLSSMATCSVKGVCGVVPNAPEKLVRSVSSSLIFLGEDGEILFF